MNKLINHSNGYLLVRVPGHPYANNDGYVPEHRLVVESSIGRYINPDKEVVHHIDHNKKNNSLGNLELLSFEDHARVHAGWVKKNGEWHKKCSGCNTFMAVEGNFYVRKANYHSGKTVFHLCKVCARLRSKKRSKKQTQDKERKFTCPVCKVLKRTHIYSQTKYCSRECHWVVRRQLKKGGE